MPLLLLCFLLFFCDNALAGPRKTTFKIASLAPQGSIWSKQFDLFQEAVRKKTDGQVAFRVYYGGVMGDDRAMLRKMRIGQLHGAGFTVTGIGELVGDFRVMSIPFCLIVIHRSMRPGKNSSPFSSRNLRKRTWFF